MYYGTKVICKLNSSICNNKQIWNGDTCRCNCNEDFAETMNNNNNNYDNDNDYNTIIYVSIGLFSLSLLIIICFCVFSIFKRFKSKYTNNTIYTY